MAWAAGHAEKGGGKPPQECASIRKGPRGRREWPFKPPPRGKNAPRYRQNAPSHPFFPQNGRQNARCAAGVRRQYRSIHGRCSARSWQVRATFPPQIYCIILSRSQEHPYFTSFFIVQRQVAAWRAIAGGGGGRRVLQARKAAACPRLAARAGDLAENSGKMVQNEPKVVENSSKMAGRRPPAAPAGVESARKSGAKRLPALQKEGGQPRSGPPCGVVWSTTRKRASKAFFMRYDNIIQ